MPQVAGPIVAFLGDEISVGLVAEAQSVSRSYANWQCINCLSSTSSTFALENLPAVIAMKPSAVHILLGAHEVSGPNFGPLPAVVGTVPLANIGTMVNMLRAANIPVVIGNLPPCQLINSYRFNWSLGEDSAGASNVSSPILGVPIIDYSAIATDDNASSVCAANLFDPNTAGYDLMVPLAEAAISQALQAASKAQ